MDTAPDNAFSFRADRLDEAGWSAVLAAFDDANIWQSWAYGAARWGADGLEHARLYDGDVVRAAAQIALPKVPLLGRPVGYVRWGPLWRHQGKPLDVALCQRFLQALHKHFVAERKTVLWIRPRNQQREDLAAAFQAAGFVREKGQLELGTFLLDLAPDLDAIRARLHKSWRRNLKRGEAQHFSFEMLDGALGYETFLSMYREMAARKGFAVDGEMEVFSNIQGALPETHRFEIWICRLDGKPASAIAVSALGDTAVGLFSVTTLEGRDARASYALDWHCIRHYRERGFRWYEIEGDEASGVNDYKMGLVGEAGHIKFVGAYMSRERPLLRRLLSLAKRVKEKSD